MGASEELKKLVDYEMVVEVEYSENWETYRDSNNEFIDVFRKLEKLKGYRRIEINEYCEIHCFDEDIGEYFGNEYADFYKKKFDDLYN